MHNFFYFVFTFSQILQEAFACHSKKSFLYRQIKKTMLIKYPYVTSPEDMAGLFVNSALFVDITVNSGDSSWNKNITVINGHHWNTAECYTITTCGKNCWWSICTVACKSMLHWSQGGVDATFSLMALLFGTPVTPTCREPYLLNFVGKKFLQYRVWPPLHCRKPLDSKRYSTTPQSSREITLPH